jgi:methionyl-tRNA formyltransferase
MRVLFFGTPDFAVPTLERLHASPHEVVGVVTQPDRPRGRGQRTSASPVKALATGRGITVLQPDTLARESVEPTLKELDPEIGVVAAYGRILPDWLLGWPRHGLLNVHASLLPKYRGAAPVHRAVIDGESETGVTIMRVVKALDEGPMLAAARVPIGPDDTAEQVEAALAEVGAELLVKTLDRLAVGPVTEVPQDSSRATYAPRLRKTDGLIDWTRPAPEIHNRVRGLHPWPHAYTPGPHGRLIVHRTAVRPPPGPLAPPGPPGTVVAASQAEGLLVATGDGLLELLEVQAEGGRVLRARAFLAGRPLKPGDRLGGAGPA